MYVLIKARVIRFHICVKCDIKMPQIYFNNYNIIWCIQFRTDRAKSYVLLLYCFGLKTVLFSHNSTARYGHRVMKHTYYIVVAATW